MSNSTPNHVGGQRTLQVLPGRSELRRDIDGFLIDRQARNLSPATVDFYRDKLSLFAGYCHEQGVKRVKDLTPNLLRHWIVRESAHRKPGGVAILYRAARAFVNWWEAEFEPKDWRNPFAKVPKPKVPVEPLDPVPVEDLKAMLATCQGRKFFAARDRAILTALLDTGLRAGEFAAINVDDVDLRTATIRIRQGKGRKPRDVFLSNRGKLDLNRYLRHLGNAHPGDPLWVCKDRHTRLKYSGLRSVVRSRARKAGVPAPSLHSFRRAFALAMHRSGADLVSLQRMLGHSDLSMLRRYLAQTTEDLAKVHRQHAPGDRLLG